MQHTHTTGTPTNMAPEVWKNMKGTKVPMSHKIDVYSYGVIMFEVCHRTQAWKDVNFTYKIKKRVIAGKRPCYVRESSNDDDEFSSKEEKDDENDGKPERFVELMDKCWHQNADMRPEFRDVVSFFNQKVSHRH